MNVLFLHYIPEAAFFPTHQYI